MNCMKYSVTNFLKIFITLIATTFVSIQILQHIINTVSQNAYRKQLIEQEFINQTLLFKSIIQTDCNATQYKIERGCLDKLSHFDKFLLSENRTKPNLNDVECINECQIMYSLNDSKVYYHTFWHFEIFNISSEADKYRLRMINLNILSYLATQNLCCTKFIIWKLDKFSVDLEALIVRMFRFYIDQGLIEIKTFLVEEFCAHGFFKKGVCDQKGSYRTLNERYLVSVSDLIRFAVLDKYGGIYTDGDTIYLRDMRMLWYMNFSYRWSFLEQYNTAVIGFNKKLDPSIDALLSAINTEQSSLESLIRGFHPNSVSVHVRKLNKLNSVYNYQPLVNLHSYFFDGAWLCNDKTLARESNRSVCLFTEFSMKSIGAHFSPAEFFPVAYTFHIHYKGTPIANNSYFFHFEKYYLSFVENLNVSVYKLLHE